MKYYKKSISTSCPCYKNITFRKKIVRGNNQGEKTMLNFLIWGNNYDYMSRKYEKRKLIQWWRQRADAGDFRWFASWCWSLGVDYWAGWRMSQRHWGTDDIAKDRGDREGINQVTLDLLETGSTTKMYCKRKNNKTKQQTEQNQVDVFLN